MHTQACTQAHADTQRCLPQAEFRTEHRPRCLSIRVRPPNNTMSVLMGLRVGGRTSGLLSALLNTLPQPRPETPPKTLPFEGMGGHRSASREFFWTGGQEGGLFWLHDLVLVVPPLCTSVCFLCKEDPLSTKEGRRHQQHNLPGPVQNENAGPCVQNY